MLPNVCICACLQGFSSWALYSECVHVCIHLCAWEAENHWLRCLRRYAAQWSCSCFSEQLAQQSAHLYVGRLRGNPHTSKWAVTSVQASRSAKRSKQSCSKMSAAPCSLMKWWLLCCILCMALLCSILCTALSTRARMSTISWIPRESSNKVEEQCLGSHICLWERFVWTLWGQTPAETVPNVCKKIRTLHHPARYDVASALCVFSCVSSSSRALEVLSTIFLLVSSVRPFWVAIGTPRPSEANNHVRRCQQRHAA